MFYKSESNIKYIKHVTYSNLNENHDLSVK